MKLLSPKQKLKRYRKFLESKILVHTDTGFKVERKILPDTLLDHAKDSIVWAANKGRAAIFSSFGMTKTRTNIGLLIEAKKQAPHAPVLVICPLGVKSQFQTEDGPVMGIQFQYIRNREEQHEATSDFHITNYERIREGDIDINIYGVVALDEGAVLRNIGTDQTRALLQKFKAIPYRYVFTAVPSAKDFVEYLNYAEFLGIMDRNQAKTRFFIRDSEHSDELELNPAHADAFWLWVYSWALFLEKPSDLGYSDEGYDLPELQINLHEVKVDRELLGEFYDRDGQYKLMAESPGSLAGEAKVKKATVKQRIAKAKEIVDASPDDNFLIWHLREDERAEIEKTIAGVVSIYGKLPIDEKEERIYNFSHGKNRLLAPKPEICGSGCNFQHYCHRAIYASIDHRFHDFLQSVFRILRFRQKQQVILDVIMAEAERHIWEHITEMWDNYKNARKIMSDLIRKYGLNHSTEVGKITRSFGCKRQQVTGKNFTAINNDSVEELFATPDNHFGMHLTSIPFGNQYEYAQSFNDFGHNLDDDRFWKQMDFLIPEKLRTLQPGRLCAVHVKDRVIPGNYSGLGMYTLQEFSDDTTKAYKKHGFHFMGRITVVTDVVRENASTYRLGWEENCKDGTKMGVGNPEYILLFRKLPSDTTNAYADVPVEKSKDIFTRAHWQHVAHQFWRSSGNRLLTPEEIAKMNLDMAMQYFNNFSFNQVYDYQINVQIAEEFDKREKLPPGFMTVAPQSWLADVWTDITRMRTLNTMQGQQGAEQHICPLPFDIVERLIYRYSNEGDLVGDVFGGLFTVPLIALQMKRKAWGCELNPPYFKTGVGYLVAEEYEQNIPTLFNDLESTGALKQLKKEEQPA